MANEPVSPAPLPAAPPAAAAPRHRGPWRRWIADPVMTQLTQGVAPDKLAQTFAVGGAISMFPILGLTTWLNLIVGVWLRMNQPIMQAFNWLLAPLHLVMIVLYVRMGEYLWGAQAAPFTVREMTRMFHEASFAEFAQRFGWAGVHAVSAWLLSLPVIIPIVFYLARPVLRHAANVLRRG